MADLAREVDRLVVGVHRAVFRAHRSTLRPMVESLRVDSPGHLLDLAEFFAVGACNAETIRLRFPYEPEEMPTKMFRQLSDRRHIGAHLEPLPTLVKVIDTLLEARADTASLLGGQKSKRPVLVPTRHLLGPTASWSTGFMSFLDRSRRSRHFIMS